MNANLNLLKYFYSVVKEGNITKAAEKFYISQPAMTRSIKELENQLNTKLLERNSKGVIPTNDGKILYNHLDNIFKDLEKTFHIIENTNKNDLYIGTTTSNFFHIISNTLKSFKELYPNIKVHIIFDNINILNEMKSLNKLDIIIKNKDELIDDFIVFDKIELENFFVASKKHFFDFENKYISIKDLLNKYPLVIMSNDSPGRKNFDLFLKNQGIKYEPTYEFNSYDLCEKLVKDGIGIGIGNNFNYDSDLIRIETEIIPKRYFEIGYLKTSNSLFVKKFLELYKK